MSADRETNPVVVFYFEYSGQGWQHHVSETWGPCRRLVEVHDDQMANRQIDFYENGWVLKYQRGKARDQYGILIGCKFSKKYKWRKSFRNVRIISQAEFDSTWSKTTCIVPSMSEKGWQGNDG